MKYRYFIMRIYIIFVISFLLFGCSFNEDVRVNPYVSKTYKIINQKRTVSLSVLNQDIEKSFYDIKNNRFYAKVSFNKGLVLVYLVGIYLKGDVSNYSAYTFDSRGHPITSHFKMGVHHSLLKINNEKALFSAKLISIKKGPHTNHLQIKNTIEINNVILYRANHSEMVKDENLYLKEMLLDNFPQY